MNAKYPIAQFTNFVIDIRNLVLLKIRDEKLEIL